MRDRIDRKASPQQVRELANAIALQAQAIADGTTTGPVFGVVCLIASNAETLKAWTRDDRQYAEPAEVVRTDPFARYTNAGLVNARFNLDDSPAYWGYHLPGERWNGWATPSFTREVLTLIIEWLTEGGIYTAEWEGDTLIIRGGRGQDDDNVERLTPTELGLYDFTGWCWTEQTE